MYEKGSIAQLQDVSDSRCGCRWFNSGARRKKYRTDLLLPASSCILCKGKMGWYSLTGITVWCIDRIVLSKDQRKTFVQMVDKLRSGEMVKSCQLKRRARANVKTDGGVARSKIRRKDSSLSGSW